MRKSLAKNPSTLVLARRELVSFQLGGEAYRIACVAGRLWVTETGSWKDSVLVPGDEATYTGRGKIVVEALRTSTVRVEVQAPTRETARALSAMGRPVTGLSA
ncbi:MAG TPA: DUF2917 domain-containing protein [Spirochaetia bacterium]|nr:DUF2917 domain-containing protein [Spirochaetia bacterium]